MTAPLNTVELGALLHRALVNAGDPPPRLLNHGGLQLIEVDLADPEGSLLAGKPYAEEGWSLRMLKHGSNPGARLELNINGRPIDNAFAPGKMVAGGFKNFRLKRALGSARIGKAVIAVASSPLAWAAEDLASDPATGPVVLLGALDANGRPSAYVSVTEDTDPSSGSAPGAFDISGWKNVAVLIDGASAAGNFTTADVVFFADPAYSDDWHEEGTYGRVSIPDADTSGFRYRSFIKGCRGRGRECPAVRNLLAAARTSLGFLIVGVD